MKKWEVVNQFKVESSKFKVEELINFILKNREIKTKKEIEEFLNPKLEIITAQSIGIDSKQLKKAIKRIFEAIEKKEQIIVFGDYDVDGICASAILWESLNSLGANVLPYIPHRIDEGYGLSVKGINNVILNLFQDLKSTNKKEMPKQDQHDKIGLIITVDNGIVANEAVEFAREQGIDVIITDHHLPSENLPKAFAIIHTTKVCGAGVSYLFSKEIEDRKLKMENSNGKWNLENGKYLELVALATIADMMPLINANRSLVKFGLKNLQATKRVGLLELFKEAVIDAKTIDVYQIGHIICPRINAMGRMEYAMESLRLLCTNNIERARLLAQKLGKTNRDRQELTWSTTEHAKAFVQSSKFKVQSSGKRKLDCNLLFIADETYEQGIIGLVAGRLVEEFYKPTIVVSKGEEISKASARSVHGFNIIEFIRSAQEHLIEAGGHPMAAGFTVETTKLAVLQEFLEKKALELLDDEKLKRVVRVDCELPLEIVNQQLYEEIQKLAPFGMGNPEPVFVSRGVRLEEVRVIGREGKHLKFKFRFCHSEFISESKKDRSGILKQDGYQMVTRQVQDDTLDAVGFGMGERAEEIHTGDTVDIVYTVDENEWQGNKSLQLKVKDLKK